MVDDEVEFLWSLISLLSHFFHVLKKAISMALCSNGSVTPWKRLSDPPASSHKRLKEKKASDGSVLAPGGCVQENLPSEKGMEGVDSLMIDALEGKDVQGLDMVRMVVPEAKVARKLRKRPARIAIPELLAVSDFEEMCKGKDDAVEKDVEVEEGGYCLASRRGTRHMMEDGYAVITNIHGDSKQAFFGVYDGHGGRAAVDFVSEKLGKNIISAIADLEGESQLEMAIKTGYSATDKEFLTKGVSSGACAATVFLKNGELHVSNVGDCRVVMSRKGVATALTSDQCAGREDERARIESSGGYVTCHNGKWRVQDSLAVSRSIGDMNMKEWVISEPETKKICLTPDCEFLIMASDGLWDKVTNQEAVDVVSQHESLMKSCKDLVEVSSRRGSRDDITVMVVDLRRFL